MFTTLTRRLLSIDDERTLLKEAVDGLTRILSAKAGLLMLQPPFPVLYATYREFSPGVATIECRFHEDATQLFVALRASSPDLPGGTPDIVSFPLIRHRSVIGYLLLDCGTLPISRHQEEGVFDVCRHLAARVGPAHADNEVRGLEISTHITQAAGDLCDLITLDAGKLGILLVHVAVGGEYARQFMRLLQATVHFLARDCASPWELVSLVDTIVHKRCPPVHLRLFSIIYGIYDSDNGLLRFSVSGGLRPPTAHPHGNDDAVRAPTKGEVCNDIGQTVVQLHPDDIVVCFANNPSAPVKVWRAAAMHARNKTSRGGASDIAKAIAGGTVRDGSFLLAKVL